jgi:hypothetical protein
MSGHLHRTPPRLGRPELGVCNLTPVGRARPLLQPSLMPEGRAALALAPTGSVRRLLAGASATTLSLILLGCSPTGSARREGSGGGSLPSHGDGSGGGGAGGALSVISGLDPGMTGGAGGSHGGTQSSGEESWGTVAFNLGIPLDGYGYGHGYGYGGGHGGASASSSSTGAGAGAGAGGGVGGSPAACDPTEAIDTSPAVPALLSATGLYQSIAAKTLSPGVLPFTPQFPLWSDGAEKHRWVHLPACAKIDTSNMDRWEMPVGTKIWKEFSFNGVRVETRYLHRWGPGPNDYVFQAYQWAEDATDATPVSTGGVKDANGTTHDIPGEWECEVCHGHSPERVLGLSAIQLSHAGPGLTIASLSAAGRLTVPSAGFSVPGNTTARAALGYLHGNCAHCHNPSPSAVWFNRPYSLKLLTTATTVAETDAFLTAVGVAPEKFVHPGITHRITAGDPASSCVAYRMSVRGSADAMPALGTEIVDPDGLARITAWISELSP